MFRILGFSIPLPILRLEKSSREDQEKVEVDWPISPDAIDLLIVPVGFQSVKCFTWTKINSYLSYHHSQSPTRRWLWSGPVFGAGDR